MRVIQPSYELTFFRPESDITQMQFMEKVVRTCYKSEGIIDDGTDVKLLRKIRKRGHLAMFEFGWFAAHITADRGFTHEMVRHRLGSFAQESTRYCNYSKDRHGREITCLQEGLSDSYSVQILTDIQERCEAAYLALLQAGNRPEIARAALPISLKAEIWVAANFREWRHIFRMRCDKAAHPTMRTVMHPLFQDVYKKYPIIFEDQAEFFLT